MATPSRSAMVPHDPSDELRRCVRERIRLARELAALRAGFATVAEHYERVVRTMRALGPSFGIDQSEIGHPADPEWGPGGLFSHGEDRFLKHEQEVADRVLSRLLWGLTPQSLPPTDPPDSSAPGSTIRP